MKKLRQLIEDCVISKNELCERADISRPTLDNILKGTFAPRILTIKKICKALGVNWKDYID